MPHYQVKLKEERDKKSLEKYQSYEKLWQRYGVQVRDHFKEKQMHSKCDHGTEETEHHDHEQELKMKI